VRRAALAALAALLVGVALGAAGCGSSNSSPTISIGAAKTYSLADWSLQDVPAGAPAKLSFQIDQPNGGAMTSFKTGPGPHTGVHLIIVRQDLGAIVHRHPPVRAGGRLEDTVRLPGAGRYRVVVDVYPATGPRNFQLFRWITVKGRRPPPPRTTTANVVVADGNRFVMHPHPPLRAIEAAFLTFTVTDKNGKPATFTPYYGALAHAIFFRKGTLDYFHTHVCGAGATGCTSTLGATRVTGTSTQPGMLRVGVLLPLSGTWRLFLQCQIDGRVVTAPFTLIVR
jgi:hypothetical protein